MTFNFDLSWFIFLVHSEVIYGVLRSLPDLTQLNINLTLLDLIIYSFDLYIFTSTVLTFDPTSLMK